MIIDTKPKLRIRKYSCYYCDCTGIITNKRVISKLGFISRDVEEMNLKSIESVNLKLSKV